jgi:hypothetical protein
MSDAALDALPDAELAAGVLDPDDLDAPLLHADTTSANAAVPASAAV